MSQHGYQQFCPVAMAAEILCTRWTLVLIRELVAGSTRFNDLRRGVPRMSPTLLSQRLRQLECWGIVERRSIPGERGTYEYRLTEAGRELRPLVEGLGIWGQRWVQSEAALAANLDPTLLMWDMRRNLRTTPFPPRRVVIQFTYPDAKRSARHWWLVVSALGEVDLCLVDPGHDVDLVVSSPLEVMTAIWMGLSTVADSRGRMSISGDPALARTLQQWLGLSPFAAVTRPAANSRMLSPKPDVASQARTA
jgi:DNA-binding HxlR family transcriptional regulator